MSNYNPKNYLLQQLFSNIKIDAKYLCITFAINLTSFIVFINHFLLGNHGFRLPYINFNDQFHAGRWFSPVIYATYGLSNIPVYIPIFTIVINILNSYLAIQIWNKRKKTALTPYSLFTLLVITEPAPTTEFLLIFNGAIRDEFEPTKTLSEIFVLFFLIPS